MIRGTTPYIEINTNFDLTAMDYVSFTLQDAAGTEVTVDNKGGMMQVLSDKIIVRLTQEQTFSLIEGELQMQIRASSESGDCAIASNVIYSYLDNVLNEEVIP